MRRKTKSAVVLVAAIVGFCVFSSPFLSLLIHDVKTYCTKQIATCVVVDNNDPSTLTTDLKELSVTIDTGSAQGSGVIVNRGEYSFVLTAGHVVSGNKKVRDAINPVTYGQIKIVEFDDVNVLQDISSYGRHIGYNSVAAKVICYSDPMYGEDLAVLLVRQEHYSYKQISFYDTNRVPRNGDKLCHVGSFRGKTGSNSFSDGLISYIGRVYNGNVYDQTSCTAFPGSSGGGIFLANTGQYVGMVVLGAGETYNLMVPIRRLKAWTDKIGLGCLIDTNLPVPSREELACVPIEYPSIDSCTSSEIKLFNASRDTTFQPLPYIED